MLFGVYLMDGSQVPFCSFLVQGCFRMDAHGTGAYRKQADREYVMIFEPQASRLSDAAAVPLVYSVHGRGVCDFGAFVVQGRYSSRDGLLEVVRDFVSETDPRAAMNLTQLRDWLKHQQALS